MHSESVPIGLKTGFVTLYPHQKNWEDIAKETILLIKSLLGDICIDAQHIGSTSIRYTYAKPIIDIAVSVNDFDDIYPYIDILSQNGIIYRKVEETGQLLFIIGDMNEKIKTHHIHVVLADSLNWHNYLNFRDYLNAFPEKAAEYNNYKLSLAKHYPDNRKAYTAGKADFIAKLLDEAMVWKEELH